MTLVGFEAWARLAGDSPTSRTEWAAVVAAWGEPHRRYHDLRHLAAVRQAVADAGGGTPPERAIPAGSDLRLYAAAGVPTLHYGPGDLHLAHGPLEKVPLAEVVTAARAFALLTLRTCGVR